MTVDVMEDLRYPVGKCVMPSSITLTDRAHAVDVLAETPTLLREAVIGLDAERLGTPYREGGWTVRQLVHHIADSHMTGFHRVRRALTEELPTVPGYDEKGFALLADSAGPVEWSLQLIDSVHARWVMMLRALSEAQWKRKFNHTERGVQSIEEMTIMYEWHSRHHLAHITRLRARKGW